MYIDDKSSECVLNWPFANIKEVRHTLWVPFRNDVYYLRNPFTTVGSNFDDIFTKNVL